MSDKTVLTLRAMAWERAKGELKSVLQTYWPVYLSDGTEKDIGFDRASEMIEKFIEDFEGECE